MTSLRHNGSTERMLLDAAREAILAVGVRRTTLTDVSRRAGVSRMTLYRRWPEMHTLLADLMTREWLAVAAESTGKVDGEATAAARLSRGVAAMVAELRANALFRKIVDVDPETLLPYLLRRRGRSQDDILEFLIATVKEGQRDGSIRPGNPSVLASAVLLAAQGYALSADTMTDKVSVRRLDRELESMLERYLAR